MQTKKIRKAENKCRAKKALATMQGDYPQGIWKSLLYLSPDSSLWLQLAHGASLGEGEFRSLLEVRLTRLTPTVLQLQYKQGRDGSGLLPENVKRNRRGKNGTTSKG